MLAWTEQEEFEEEQWELGKEWWSPLPCRPTLVVGIIFKKELYKKQAKKRHNETCKESTHMQVLST
jgi:hypothetical protein